MKITVDVVYKNKDMRVVDYKHYPIQTYCSMMKANTISIINDIESQFNVLHDKNNKSQWSEDVLKSFQNIRHKLLDIANSFSRLPDSIKVDGQALNQIDMAEYLANVINNGS